MAIVYESELESALEDEFREPDESEWEDEIEGEGILGALSGLGRVAGGLGKLGSVASGIGKLGSGVGKLGGLAGGLGKLGGGEASSAEWRVVWARSGDGPAVLGNWEVPQVALAGQEAWEDLPVKAGWAVWGEAWTN
jgi:hypothetical protein